MFATKQSLPSLSLTVAKWSVKNVQFCALALCVIYHEVSPLQVFFWQLHFCYGDHFTIEGRQKVTFWKSELGALLRVLLKKILHKKLVKIKNSFQLRTRNVTVCNMYITVHVELDYGQYTCIIHSSYNHVYTWIGSQVKSWAAQGTSRVIMLILTINDYLSSNYRIQLPLILRQGRSLTP